MSRRGKGPAFADSTFGEQAWDQSRAAGSRWALAGVALGALVGVVAFAPAAWLAAWAAQATDGRLLLADVRGTVWSGSALPVLTGGLGSRDASALPGRLEWTLGVGIHGIELEARQACCLNVPLALRMVPGWRRSTTTLMPAAGVLGHWPAAWLAGLGTPFNTLEPRGTVQLSSPGFTLDQADGRTRLRGTLSLDLLDISSRIATLEPLGSWRVVVEGDANGPPRLALSTLGGPLLLQGAGSWGPGGLRFRGEASAAPHDESALSNLLNIIGRRNGARSVISIG